MVLQVLPDPRQVVVDRDADAAQMLGGADTESCRKCGEPRWSPPTGSPRGSASARSTTPPQRDVKAVIDSPPAISHMPITSGLLPDTGIKAAQQAYRLLPGGPKSFFAPPPQFGPLYRGRPKYFPRSVTNGR
jgi:hypothetical protein